MPNNESSYTEESTGLIYSSDAAFISSGKSGEIKNIEDLFFGMASLKPYKYLRHFPEGTRNCYNLTVVQGTHYLIRAVFLYGNYDDLKQKQIFDLYLGPNLWSTISLEDAYDSGRLTFRDSTIEEMIHMPKSNSLDICLVKTGKTTPFISALELRPLRDDSYTTKTGSLKLYSRWSFTNTGSIIFNYDFIRYVIQLIHHILLVTTPSVYVKRFFLEFSHTSAFSCSVVMTPCGI